MTNGLMKNNNEKLTLALNFYNVWKKIKMHESYKPVVSNEIVKQLVKENNVLEMKLCCMKKQNEYVRERMGEREKEVKRIQKCLFGKKKEVMEMENVKEELENFKNAFNMLVKEKEEERMKYEFYKKEYINNMNKMNSNVKKEIDKVKNCTKKLIKDCEVQYQTKKRYQELEKYELLNEIGKIEEEMTAESKEKDLVIKELKRMNDELEEKKKDLEKNCSELVKFSNELEKKNEDLQEMNDELEHQNNNLDMAVVELSTNISDLKKYDGELEKKNDDLGMAVDELSENIIALKSKNEELKKKNIALRERIDDECVVKQLEGKIVKLNFVIDNGVNERDELVVKNQELEKKLLSYQLRSISDSEFMKVKSKNKELVQELHHHRTASEVSDAESTELKSKNETLENDVSELKSQLKKMKREITKKDSYIHALGRKLTIQKRKSHTYKLLTDMDDKEKDEKIAKIKKENGELSTCLSEIIEKYQGSLIRLEDEKKKCLEYFEENDKLKKKVKYLIHFHNGIVSPSKRVMIKTPSKKKLKHQNDKVFVSPSKRAIRRTPSKKKLKYQEDVSTITQILGSPSKRMIRRTPSKKKLKYQDDDISSLSKGLSPSKNVNKTPSKKRVNIKRKKSIFKRSKSEKENVLTINGADRYREFYAYKRNKRISSFK